MATSNTVTRVKEQGNGMLLEEGTFTSSGGDVTMTITASTTDEGQKIARIEKWGFASDGDHTIAPAKDVHPDQVKITFTANDTGNYWIEGPAS